MESTPVSWQLAASEQRDLVELGYVVREAVFGPGEVAEIAEACEELVADLVRDRQGTRMRMGSYVFDPDLLRGVTIKWEGDTDVVHGIEPFAHLSPALDGWAHDHRLVDPMRDLVGDDAPCLFTEKLNLKRAAHGGPNPLHQDYPYWADVTRVASRIATAIVFLDDATIENGCLQVLPGSHRRGVWKGRSDGDAFLANEIDPAVAEDERDHLVAVEVPAGSVLLFGAFLVHQSAPNTSGRDRRALLYSYQPAGEPTMRDFLRRLAGATAGP